jgi:PAS domain S-box-containing protein
MAQRARQWLPKGGVLADTDWNARHRTIVWLLILQGFGLFMFGAIRGVGLPHSGVEAMIPLLCAWAADRVPGRDLKAVVASFGLVACSGILVHLSGGTIEAHFHFFIMLAVISLYQEWRAFLMAILFVVLHHGIVGVIDPASVYNHLSAQRHPWTWAGIHALLVLGESVALVAAWRFSEHAHARAQESSSQLISEKERHLEEQLAAQARVRNQEVRLEEAQAIAHLGSWDWDLATNKVSGSEELFRIFGVDPTTFNPDFDNFIARIHPEDRPVLQEAIAGMLASGEPYTVEFRVVKPDGTTVNAMGSGRVSLNESGEPGRVVGILQDVTERKSLESQLLHAQKMEAVGHLAGGVAHDFNNLLAIVINYSRLLGDEVTDESSRADLEEIVKAANQGARLTRQLLNFARKEVTTSSTLYLCEVLQDISVLLERTLGESCDLRIDVADDVWPVQMDRTQVEQVLMNLAVNARDAMPGGGTLAVEAHNAGDEERPAGGSLPAGDYIRLSVTDTGVGMSAATLEHIFEPFFTTKPRERGSGLGLATVYGIVERAGGRVMVKSQPGAGSRFDIYLPRSENPVERSVVEEAVSPPTGSEKILVVEDQPSVAMITQRILTRAGYEVSVANDGAEGLKLFSEHPDLDLVITDIVMPGLTGPDLAARLAEFDPAPKVVYMSGYSNDLIESGDGPTYEYLQKPFHPEELLTLVRKVLDGRSVAA